MIISPVTQQLPRDRPDLCTQVFDMKLKDLMESVIEEKVFGNAVAQERVIEFQKRGLLPVHCMFILDQASKHALRNPARVNAIIIA